MAEILVLPPHLASQIAAGEVVERPASAVKELVENALDAGATRVDIECRGGGVSLVSVRDDGTGMSEGEVWLALERHATSKLREISDLERLGSFGFRGEALPSIAAVSRVRILSRARDAESGVAVELEGGQPKGSTPLSMPVGTTVEVRDLFFNVPARRKFLRSTGTESSHVTQVVEAAALSRPLVTFTLTRDGRLVREFLRAPDRAGRVAQLFCDEPLTRLVGERGPLVLEAFLLGAERARPGAAGLWLFVNGRVIRDRMLAATIAQAHKNQIPSGHYPRGVVYLELPTGLVDVNTHPQKTEVRFADPRSVADAVYAILSPKLLPFAEQSSARHAGSNLAVSPRFDRKRPPSPADRAVPEVWRTEPRALASKTSPAMADAGGPDGVGAASDGAGWPSETRGPDNVGAADAIGSTENQGATSSDVSFPSPTGDAHTGGEAGDPSPGDQAGATNAPSVLSDSTDGWSFVSMSRTEAYPKSTALKVAETSDGILERANDTEGRGVRTRRSREASFGGLRFLVQVRLTYLVCEGADGLYLIDQHAASERVAFHRLLAQHRSRSVSSQVLLFPAMVELTPAQTELIERRQADFTALGMEVRVRDRQRVSIHAIPKLLLAASPERLLHDLLGELSTSNERGFSLAIERALALFACHGALRAGEVVLPAQATALLRALSEVDFSAPCTHGRPIVATMSFAELERKVGRR